MEEKRRFFRINETIGLAYEGLDDDAEQVQHEHMVDLWELMSEQDEKIESLLQKADTQAPVVADLVRAFNQKLERIVRLLVVENRMVDRLANKAKEVNISACGIGFWSDRPIAENTRLKLEIRLFPGDKSLTTGGRVIACEAEGERYFWRIDFFDMSRAEQENLIQHIVQRQSAQLKASRAT